MNRCAKAHPFSHEELCKKAEISSIDVYHSNEYCNGIYVEYKSTFSNGFTERTMPPSHRYNSGYYARSDQRSTITLQEGEYLAEIRTRQGEITDQITFITNQRTVSFGGNGGSGEDMSIPPDLSRRIVAFVGTFKGILESWVPYQLAEIGKRLDILYFFVHLSRRTVLI